MLLLSMKHFFSTSAATITALMPHLTRISHYLQTRTQLPLDPSHPDTIQVQDPVSFNSKPRSQETEALSPSWCPVYIISPLSGTGRSPHPEMYTSDSQFMQNLTPDTNGKERSSTIHTRNIFKKDNCRRLISVLQ